MGINQSNQIKTIKSKNTDIDADKINSYIIKSFSNYVYDDFDDDILCVIIFSDHGLNQKELTIAKKIIVSHGFNYWEAMEESHDYNIT